MTQKGKPTRSEILRSNRGRRARKPSRSSHRDQNPPRSTLPPILVRGGVGAAVSQSRKRKKGSRRRYDIALNSQGAEMQLPSIPRIRIGWRLLSALLVASLSALIYFLWTTPFLKVMDLDLEGVTRLTRAELNSVMDVVGNTILTVNPEILEEELMIAFPQLVNVDVDTDVPNRVIINLVERQPVIAWTQEGKVSWIDAQGIVFSPHGDWQPDIQVISNDLPLIRPPEIDSQQDEEENPPAIPEEVVNTIITVSREAPENTPMVYDGELGIGWQDPSGWEVFFGSNDEDLDMKLRVYYKTWKRLKKLGIVPAVINVEHVNAPYYRLER